MAKTIISEGKTTNEAIEKGLKELNVSRKMVDVKVLENGEKRSFFSILAPRVVKVELIVKENAENHANNEKNRENKTRKELILSKEEQEKAIENVMREAMEAQRMAAEKQAQNSGENMQNNHQQHSHQNPSAQNYEQYPASEMPPIPEGVYNDVDYAMPTDADMGYIPEMPENEEPSNIIFGKPSRAKETLFKIKDITSNDSRVTIEGRIVSCECKETKTG